MPKRPREIRADPVPIPLVARLELPATNNLFFIDHEPPLHKEANGDGDDDHGGPAAAGVPVVDMITSEEAKRRLDQGVSQLCSLPLHSTSLPLSSVMVTDKWAFVSVFDGDCVLRVVKGVGDQAAALWVDYLVGGVMRRVMIPFETVGALRIDTTTSPWALDPFAVQCNHCQRRFVSQSELHTHQEPCGGYQAQGEAAKAKRPPDREGVPAVVLALTRAPVFHREVAATLDEEGNLQWLLEKEETDPSGGQITQLLQLTLVSRDPGSDLKAALQPLVDHFHARQQDIKSRLQEMRRGSPSLGAGEELVVLQRNDKGRDLCDIGKGVVKSFDDGYYQVVFAEQEAAEEEEAEDMKEKEVLALLFNDLPSLSAPASP